MCRYSGAGVVDALWVLTGLAAAPVAGLVALSRYRLQRRMATSAVATAATGEEPHHEYHLPSTIEAAEREMAMLLARIMRQW